MSNQNQQLSFLEYPLKETELGFNIDVSKAECSFDVAKKILWNQWEVIAKALKFNNKKEARIVYDGGSLGVLASMIPDDTEQQKKSRAIANMNRLLHSSHPQLLEFLAEQYNDGKIVILTGHRSNICLYTSSQLKPSRAIWKASQFRGYDYLQSWRGADQSLDKYYNPLIRTLDTDGYAVEYEYQLIRPADGALVSYATSYYKAIGGWEDEQEEIRVGVSDPQAFHVISAPDPSRIIPTPR